VVAAEACYGGVKPIEPVTEVTLMANAPVLWPFPWFATPNRPDLGCFVRNEHGFQVDSNFFFWLEYAPGVSEWHARILSSPSLFSD
jgi:hypothetical protein